MKAIGLTFTLIPLLILYSLFFDAFSIFFFNMVKSPTPRSRQKNTPFTKEEEIWIVRNAGSKGSMQIRREFIIQFSKSNKHKVPGPRAFRRIVERFDSTGGVTGQSREPIFAARTPENIEKVRNYFEEDCRRSIRQATRDLNLGFGTVWIILRKDLRWKPYRFKRVQKLSAQNKEARVDFCTWVLGRELGFETRIIFSDEKFFVLHQAPNQQNDRCWAPFDPQEEVECNIRFDTKVMAWSALIDDSVLTIRWMDEPHRPPTVTAVSYLDMIRDEVWPEVRNRAQRRLWWWMQDGASVHCTDDVIHFLEEKFRGRVITRRGEHPWPPYSPDLNPLDFYFWGFAMAEVFRQKPATIAELKQIVEDLARELSGEIIRTVMANFRRRCEACLEADGGAFEYSLG